MADVNELLGITEEDGEPSEEKSAEADKTAKPNDKDGKEKKDESRSSAVFQKAKYREKYERALAEKEEILSRVKELEAELRSLKDADPDDRDARKEIADIRTEIKSLVSEALAEQKKEEEKALRIFQEELDEVLEENEGLTEEELLDAIEEFDVSPRTAAKILARPTKEKQKPKLPKPTKAKAESDEEKPDTSGDRGKSMWKIAQEEAQRLKKLVS